MPPLATRLARLPLAVACLMGLVGAAGATRAAESKEQFRVCADPNNLPFSNEKRQGFENKLAQLIADQLHETVTYSWWAQRRGNVRKTLKAHLCDVIMGVPTQLDMLGTTRPYYRSTYVFVSRLDRHIDIRSISDPRLQRLLIGVQLIGDDGFNTPPAHALGQQGIVNNVVGFPIYGDYRRPSPAARIIAAVQDGQIDVAAAWGPLAGYFAKHAPVPLRVEPITDTARFAPLRFQFDISVGVRKDDRGLRSTLDVIIAQHQPEIDALLRSYGVPLESTGLGGIQPASTSATER
ncbi:MAG TPA: substrate-binding domain-containing protein [Acetobacteraceae bacterium]